MLFHSIHLTHVLVVNADAGTGGNIRLTSGPGTSTSSGALLLTSHDAGKKGVSGEIALRTGTASYGDSGHVQIVTGGSTAGKAGQYVKRLRCKIYCSLVNVAKVQVLTDTLAHSVPCQATSAFLWARATLVMADTSPSLPGKQRTRQRAAMLR